MIYKDLFRYNGKQGLSNLIMTYIRKPSFRFIANFRWFQSGHMHQLARILLQRSTHATHIEIGWKTTIGEGVLLVHPCGIAVNNEVVIGRNCTIYGGVTIGMEFRGKRCGNPVIGDSVWFGANSTVVGNISIGNDVLIAPNSYVNFDVPSHSIVIGNPARIIQKENATYQYIKNKI